LAQAKLGYKPPRPGARAGSEPGQTHVIPPHPGLRQDGGPGKAFPKPADGATYAKEAAEKGMRLDE